MPSDCTTSYLCLLNKALIQSAIKKHLLNSVLSLGDELMLDCMRAEQECRDAEQLQQQNVPSCDDAEHNHTEHWVCTCRSLTQCDARHNYQQVESLC